MEKKPTSELADQVVESAKPVTPSPSKNVDDDAVEG